jgi:hypothetical protein
MASSIFIPDMVDEIPSGIFASQANRGVLPVIVATTDLSRKAAHNRVRKDLAVVACANFKELNFAFDSSVIRPEAREWFTALARVIRRHPGSPMSLFGHADPTGEPGYNKHLSERRARSVFAVMINDTTIWEDLFRTQIHGTGDNWGTQSLQVMLNGLLEGELALTGKLDEPTKEAIRVLLGLPPGAPVASTTAVRQEIFRRYMDFLRTPPKKPPPEKDDPPFPDLGDDDFLGRGKQKGTLQGCSEFNPQLLLGRKELAGMTAGGAEGKESRDAANEPNRRVVVYLFAKGTVIDAAKWPCPSAAQGIQACIDHFWSNGKARKDTQFEEHRRRFGREVRPERRVLAPPNPALAEQVGREETTFACRFYHGIALHSPCERDVRMWVLQLMIDGVRVAKPGQPATSGTKIPLANRRFVATVGTSADAPVIRGRTTVNGVIGLPFFDDNLRLELKVDAFADAGGTPEPVTTLDSEEFPDEHRFVPIKLDAGRLLRLRGRRDGDIGFDPDFDLETPEPGPEERDLGALQRLYNLGYGPDDTGGPKFGNWDDADRKAAIEQFQRDQQLDVTGTLDEPTLAALFEEHGS